MTTKTVFVRVDSAGDRERNATISRTMTTVTPDAAMLCMVELVSEAAQRRERFHRASLRVCMTDCTDWTTAIRKQRLMTTDTRRVLIFSGQGWLYRIVFAPVTQQTRQSRMVWIFVLKL